MTIQGVYLISMHSFRISLGTFAIDLTSQIAESSIGSLGSTVREGVLTQAVMSIKAIIRQNPASHEKVITALLKIEPFS